MFKMREQTKQAIYAESWHGDQPYDSKECVRLEKACRVFLHHAGELAPHRRFELLDVGCGVGPLRRWLPAETFRIVGLEISAEATDRAKANYDACEVGDVENPWPFVPASFDGVHAGAIMEHVLDWHAPLNHACLALRDRGVLVIATPNLRYWKEIRRLIRGRQPHWLTAMEHVHGYTRGFLETLVEMHGFEVIDVQADRLGLAWLGDRPWVCRRFAGLGSVLILSARLRRRVRVEDSSRMREFPSHKPLPLRSIEVPLNG